MYNLPVRLIQKSFAVYFTEDGVILEITSGKKDICKGVLKMKPTYYNWGLSAERPFGKKPILKLEEPYFQRVSNG